MLMKYRRGAEAISIFKPTDTTSTPFCLGWLGLRWCRESGTIVYLFLHFLGEGGVFLFHLNQTVKTSGEVKKKEE